MKLYNLINPKYWIDFFTFYGGSDSGGSQTSYQTTIPETLVPYAEDIAQRAEGLSQAQYTPYGQERLAGMAPAQQRALSGYENLQTSPYFPAAGLAALQATQMGTQPGQFGAEQAAQYMSPYQQSVTDIAKRQARSDAEKMRTDLAGRAQRAGAFGGSRYGLMEGKLYSDLGTRLSDIQTKGSQAAFSQAQQQFERDRMARQQAARLGLSGAQTLGQLGTTAQSAELQRLKSLERAGTLRQADRQRLMDMQYQDFVRQQEYPYKQLQFYSDMVRGLQGSTPVSSRTVTPTPSPFQTLAGLGIAGLGAYKAFQG
tara:strand:+ start:887 stop:1825 length:939 start_codon:yes stop_codon:yes gene_type:complete